MIANPGGSAQDPNLRGAFLEYARELSLALQTTERGPLYDRIEKNAIAVAILAFDNKLPSAGRALWVALGWRALADREGGPARLSTALAYLEGVVVSRSRALVDRDLRAKALLGTAVAYSRLPGADVVRIRAIVLRRLRAATRIALEGVASPELLPALLSTWADVFTSSTLAPGTRPSDVEGVLAVGSSALLPASGAPGRAMVDFAVGVATSRRGDFVRAERLLRRAASVATADQDWLLAGGAYAQASEAARRSRGLGESARGVRLQRSAVRMFTAAGSPELLGDAERVLALLLLESGDTRGASRAFRRAIAALERALDLASLGVDIDEVTIGLAQARHALAACLVRLDRVADAALAADAARARRLRDAAFARTKAFGLVRRRAPLLADEFLALGHVLRDADEAEYKVRASPGDDALERLTAAASARDRARHRRAELLAFMRGLPGVAARLRPITLRRVRAAVPRAGVIVYVIPTPWGGTAILVSNEDVRAIDLPLLTNAALGRRLRALTGAYDATRRRPGDPRLRGLWSAELDRAARWAWRACMGAIVRAGGNAQTIVLIAAGGLEFLPLHAAWRSRGGERRFAIDDVAISYAPCADLIGASATLSSAGATIIADPAPTSKTSLPGARSEGIAVSAAFDSPHLLIRADATSERVLHYLAEARAVHAACHGRTEFGSPYASYLLLACDVKLTVGQILDLRLDGGPSTFLSACETGLRNFELADEVLSLGASFLAAGAAEVVSTLWTVDDHASAILALKYYVLRKTGLTGAESLRLAQKWLRDTPKAAIAAEIQSLPWLDAESRNTISALVTESTADYQQLQYWAAFIYSG